jgi:hypothetical protein
LLLLWILKWTFEHLNKAIWVYLVAIGVGWGGYVFFGAMLPHTDPQIGHSITAPFLGGLALIIGFMSVRERRTAF